MNPVLRIDIIREIILFCQSKSSNNKKHSPTVFLFSRLLSLVWVPLCLLEKETTRGHSLGPDKNQLIRSMTTFQLRGKNPRQQDRTVRHRERRQNPRPLPNGLRDEHGGRSWERFVVIPLKKLIIVWPGIAGHVSKFVHFFVIQIIQNALQCQM